MQVINIGITADDGTGDPIRAAFDKTNDNFSELLAAVSGVPPETVTLNFDDMVAIQSKLSSYKFVPGDYATLELARTEVGAAGKTVVVTTPLTEAQSNITAAWSADRALKVEKGGSIANSTEFIFAANAVFNAGNYQSFSGAGAVTFNNDVGNPVGWFYDTQDVTFNAGIVAGPGLISRNMSFGPDAKVSEVRTDWFGFTSEGDATLNTVSLQRAIDQTPVTSFARFAFAPTPTDNATTGYAPTIIIPYGFYKINDAVTYGPYHNFKSDHAIINQIDDTKDVFYSVGIYQNTFTGIVFVGGKTHIFSQNGVTGVYGREGVLTKIRDCDFQKSASFAVQFKKSGAGGGEQGMIDDSRFFFPAQMIYTDYDMASINKVWNEPYAPYFVDDTAQIVNYSRLTIDNFMGVPASLGETGYTGTTHRWIDNYSYVSINNSRFGSESGGGIPIVYNFANALSDTTYPYFARSAIIIKNSSLGSLKGVGGVVVIKSGLPNIITIEDCMGASAPIAYINTSAMTSGTLTTYLGSLASYQPLFKFSILRNIGYGARVTSSNTDTSLLIRWMDYDLPAGTGQYSGHPQSTTYTRKVVKLTIPYTDFAVAATTKTLPLFTLPVGGRIISVVSDTQTRFAGTGLTNVTLAIGDTTVNSVLLAHDVRTAAVVAGVTDASLGGGMTRAASIQGGYMPAWATSTVINATMVGTGANLSAMSQGSVYITIAYDVY